MAVAKRKRMWESQPGKRLTVQRTLPATRAGNEGRNCFTLWPRRQTRKSVTNRPRNSINSYFSESIVAVRNPRCYSSRPCRARLLITTLRITKLRVIPHRFRRPPIPRLSLAISLLPPPEVDFPTLSQKPREGWGNRVIVSRRKDGHSPPRGYMELRNGPRPLTLAAHFVVGSFLLYLGLAAGTLVPSPPEQSRLAQATLPVLLVLLALAVTFRIAWILRQPESSNSTGRQMWLTLPLSLAGVLSGSLLLSIALLRGRWLEIVRELIGLK